MAGSPLFRPLFSESPLCEAGLLGATCGADA
jgi:hypothetical protein